MGSPSLGAAIFGRRCKSIEFLGLIHQTLTLMPKGRILLQGCKDSSCLVSCILSVFKFLAYHFHPPGKMTIRTNLDEKLEGANNFRAWKYRVMCVLEESDLERFIEVDIPEP